MRKPSRLLSSKSEFGKCFRKWIGEVIPQVKGGSESIKVNLGIDSTSELEKWFHN